MSSGMLPLFMLSRLPPLSAGSPHDCSDDDKLTLARLTHDRKRLAHGVDLDNLSKRENTNEI